MLIILYLLQLEKDAFVMQTVFIVVAWSLMHCCQQQNELALWILNWETNIEPESGTMTFTGLKYITQLWEGAFVASANYHLFLILELVEHFSEMVKNCRTNNLIIYVPMGFYSLSGKQISHGLFPIFDDSYFFFPINNLSFILLHACFEFLQFLAYCISTAALWKYMNTKQRGIKALLCLWRDVTGMCKSKEKKQMPPVTLNVFILLLISLCHRNNSTNLRMLGFYF